MTVLDEICRVTRIRVAERRELVPEELLAERVAGRDGEHRFLRALERPGLSVIAEFKRRSPSAGEIRPGSSVEEVVLAYEAAGAAALSVLTDQDSFGGSLADLEAASRASSLPVLRKDFILERYQVLEAAAAGADAVLLIVAALSDEELVELGDAAAQSGLDTLVEVHDSAELARALDVADPPAIGINNRNLKDLSIDPGLTAELMAGIPSGKAVVSESGISTPERVEELELAGVDAILVGESLMRAEDPGNALRILTRQEAG